MNELRSGSIASQPQSDQAFTWPASLQLHADLLGLFVTRREFIVDKIAGLLNCQRKPLEYQQDPILLSRQFKDCFFMLAGLTYDQSQLRDQLELLRCASGFKPRENAGNDLVDPAQLLIRALHMWRQTRWPGQKGRLRYADTLFNVYLVRCLALLSLRIWDEEPAHVGARLAQAQALLDQLWTSSPADQPRLVRDVRWLIPVAMSPTTDELAGYFAVSAKIEATLPCADQTEVFRAWVQTGAGHLCSQLRHLSAQRSVSLDDNSLLLLTRRSNALDVALLVQGLVTLLMAYESSLQGGDDPQRLSLATAICQGLAPDPDLFVNRHELLCPYSMIEHLFIETDAAGQTAHTPMGLRHLRLLDEYKKLIARLAPSLLSDWQRCGPVAGGYSPHGALFGFSSNLLELMAMQTLLPQAVAAHGLEDVFAVGDADKRAWVSGWRKLPHISTEVAKQYEYPQDFVAAIGARIEQALQRRIAGGEGDAAASCGKLFIVAGEVAQEDAALSPLPELPSCYLASSDQQFTAASNATSVDQGDLLHCRLEGEYLVSYQRADGWVAISKDMLTDVLGAGRNVKISWLPREVGDVLQLMCPGLVERISPA